MYTPRPIGTTSRRVKEALHRPHDSVERFDPEFPVALKCERCGKFAHGPRSQMRGAMEEHWRSDCPVRHTKQDEPLIMQILYPRI